MESILSQSIFNLIKYLPQLFWLYLYEFFQWFVPRSWYAKDVSDDTVLITGAGSGLGRAVALEYAQLNSSLVLWDINESGLQETKRLVLREYEKQAEIRMDRNIKGPACLVYKVDVSDKIQIQKTSERVFEDLNKTKKIGEPDRYVTVLINNAGIYFGLYFQDLTDDMIEKIFRINIMAHLWTVRAFLPNMIKYERGHIVEIASVAGLSAMYKQVDYCATKFATVGFEESLDLELRHLGLADKIKTTCICPLFFSSNLFNGFNDRAAQLMSVDYVAKETVITMRCNHSRVILPRFKGYFGNLIRPLTPRRASILWAKIMGFEEGIKEIRGTAVPSKQKLRSD